MEIEVGDTIDSRGHGLWRVCAMRGVECVLYSILSGEQAITKINVFSKI